MQRFKVSICDESGLELLDYSVNGKEVPEKTRLNFCCRFAAHRTFFGILELNGLDKGRRFKLPTCLVLMIRSLK